MIVDLNAFAGNWPFYPVKGDMGSVRKSLHKYGIKQIFISPLDGVWCRNPHIFNSRLYQEADILEDIWPVPIIDPTIATWKKELEYALKNPKVKLVKLLPAYVPYRLSEADSLLSSLTEADTGVIIQTRMEDPRRQHPLAQVPDVPAKEIAFAAERHSDLIIIIGGPRRSDIMSIKSQLLDLPNFYADVSQVEGMNGLLELVESGLKSKLVFGSHAPIFIPHSAMVRVITDLDDETSKAILWENAKQIINRRT